MQRDCQYIAADMTVEIPTGHVSPRRNGVRGNPNLYLDQPIKKRDANQLEAMFLTPTTVLLPPGFDRVAVYKCLHLSPSCPNTLVTNM